MNQRDSVNVPDLIRPFLFSSTKKSPRNPSGGNERPVSHISGKFMIHHHSFCERSDDFRKKLSFLITSSGKVLKTGTFYNFAA